MRKTVIEIATGDVVNVIEIKEGAEWVPAEGQMIGADGGEMGQRWNGISYTWINPPVSEIQEL